MRAWQRAALTTGLLGLAVAVGLATLPSAEVWSGLTPGDCAEYCENHDRCGSPPTRAVIQQPLNTWSNLAYIYVGLGVLFAPNVSVIGWLFGTSCLLLGAGSFLFHAAITREFQWLDVTGMYAVLVALLAAGIHRLSKIPPVPLVAAAITADILLGLYKWQLNTWFAIPGLAAAVGALMFAVVYRDGESWRDPAICASLLAVALLLQRLDVNRVVCFPHSLLFQGHAVWHVLTAIVLYRTFRFLLPWPPGGSGRRHQQSDRAPEWYREAA